MDSMTEIEKKKVKVKKTAESMALNYISYRDRSVLEMRAYLEKKNYSTDEIEVCLENLTEWGLLDDEGFCRKFIRHSKDKERGPIRIRYDLRNKGIDQETIEKCMEEELSREEEIEIAFAIGGKILSDEASEREDKNIILDEKLKGKIARRLASRGFSGNVVYTVINKLKSS